MRSFLQQNTFNGHNPAFSIKGRQSTSKLGNFCVCCSFSVVGIGWLFPILKQCNALYKNAELNPICHLLALLGAHHILHVSRLRVKLNFMVYLFILAKMYV
jgi:hypothetical protein